jgi:catechol 2,3-dioxygenase-like lactoylglutathione lyase family enzyme
MAMKPRISLVTLGVEDIERAKAFYSALGFAPSRQGNDDVAYFQLAGGTVLSLYRRWHLFRDAGLKDSGARFSGITLAYNTASVAEVDEIVAAFAGAGGTIIKKPHEVSWGGTIAYAADPDGHVWEIAHNPDWRLNEDGELWLPG